MPVGLFMTITFCTTACIRALLDHGTVLGDGWENKQDHHTQNIRYRAFTQHRGAGNPCYLAPVAWRAGELDAL